MNMLDDSSFRDLCVGDIVVTSGIRPMGRTVSHVKMGRAKNGLLYIWRGKVTFWGVDKKTVTASDGALIFIPKGHRYKMQYTAENTTFVLVNCEMFNRNREDLVLFEDITVVCHDDESQWIAGVMGKFEVSGSSEGPAAEFRRKELLYRLFSLIYQQQPALFTERHQYPQILKGTLLLKQSYLENIPITKFAEVCNISVSSFRALFHKQYGMSPLKYRNYLRVNRARELLSEGGCTVAEAAFASGFENIGYFCNCYKKITGQTPTQTRELTNTIKSSE